VRNKIKFNKCFKKHPFSNFIDTARIVRGRVYVTVRYPSVCPCVCPSYRLLQQRAAGLLLWARLAGDIERLLHGWRRSTLPVPQHGAQQQMRAVPRIQRT